MVSVGHVVFVAMVISDPRGDLNFRANWRGPSKQIWLLNRSLSKAFVFWTRRPLETGFAGKEKKKCLKWLPVSID